MSTIGGSVPTPERAPSVLVLGPVGVRLPDGTVRRLPGLAGRLLAGLVARHPHPASRHELVEVLWPAGPPASAAAALRVHLTKLRRALAEVGVQIEGEGGYLALPGAADVVDLFVAEAWADRARRQLRSEGAPESAAATARAALGLFRAAPFPDADDEPTLRAARSRAEELRWHLEELAVEADLAAGRHEELVGRVEALVDAEPLRERRWAQLMLALYRSGRAATALATAQRARRTLGELVGTEPGPEIVDLERSILVHDPALAARPVATARSAPSDQLRVVGRTEVLDRLGAVGPGGVATIVGPAGAGTSTVLGAFVRERAPDRYATVHLLEGEDVAARLDERVGGADATEGPTLLAVDPGDADLGPIAAAVARAVGGDDRPAVLVAARRPLGLPDEEVVALGPLGAVDAADLLARRLGADAVDADLRAVAAEVGGHPLSLCLAAGLVRSLGAAVVARDVASGALSLTAGDDEVVGAVAAARGSLEPVPAALLGPVAWFHGPVDVDAVATVGGVGTGEAAGALVAWQLAGLAEPVGDGRWRLPPATRDALRHLGEAEGTAAEGRRRRSDHLRRLVADHGLACFGLDGPGVVARLGPWHDELVRLGDGAIAAGDLDVAAEVAEGLLWYWEAAGRTVDGDRWLRRAVAALDRHPDHPAAPRLLALAATSGPTVARLVARADLARRAVAAVRAPTDRRWAGLARVGLAAELVWAGDAAAAERALVAAADELDPAWEVPAQLVSAMGAVMALAGGDLDGARTRLTVVHQRSVELGSTYLQHLALVYLAWVADAAGDGERAVRCYRAAIDLAEVDGVLDPDHARIGLARHLVVAGEDDEARHHLEAAVVGRLAARDLGWAAECLCGVGEVAARAGATEEALAAFRHALQLGWRVRDRSPVVRAVLGLARGELAAGRCVAAARALGALEGCDELGGRPARGEDLAAVDALRFQAADGGADAERALVDGAARGIGPLVAEAGLDLALDRSEPR